MKCCKFSVIEFIKVYFWILSYLRNCIVQFLVYFFSLLSLILLEVSMPVFIGKIIDGKGNTNKIYIIIFIMILGIMFFSILVNSFSSFIQIKPVHIMQRQVFIKVSNLGIPYYEKNDIGKILSLFNTNIEKVSYLYKQGIHLIIRNIVSLIFSMIFLCNISTRFLVYVIICYIPYIILAKFFSNNIAKCMEKQVQIHKEYDGLLYEQLSMIEEFRMARNEKWVRNENDLLYKKYSRIRIKTIFFRYLRGMLFRLTSAIGIIIYMYLMLNRLFLEEKSIGILVVGLVYITNVFWNINGLIHTFTEQVTSVYYAKGLYNLLNVKDDKEKKKIDKKTFENEIKLSNVSFTYKTEEKRGLFGVNLTIRKGEKIVICGSSGSGKSTFLKLISGSYSTYSGDILMDGISYKAIKSDSICNMIGYMFQETYLFSMSVKDNILLGNYNKSIEEVMEAAKKVKIHDFIMSLPSKYDAIIQNKGSFLSGGQCQRIALARILLKNPQIILLDEITSALDKNTRDEIMNTIMDIFKSKTVIAITHNSDEFDKYDKIVSIIDGEIINNI